jgi:hypothetical protein
MTFEILSKKRNRLLTIISISLLFVMAISGFVGTFFDLKICIYIFFAIIIYNISPLVLLGNKKIGKLTLSENGIDFITQEGIIVQLRLDEIEQFKFYYYGYQGQIESGYKRISWNRGNNKLIIKTISDEYEIPFLGDVVDNKKMIIRYINVLKENNVKYHFEIGGNIYSTLKQS